MESYAVLVNAEGAMLSGAAAGNGPPGLLDGLQNGAYTSALIRGSPLSIVDWDLHQQRLLRSLTILSRNHVESSTHADVECNHPSTSHSACCQMDDILQLVEQRTKLAVTQFVTLSPKNMKIQSAMLFVYVEKSTDLQVLVFIKSYEQPALHIPVQVAVMGPPRNLARAQAKYSAWIQERKSIEARKPKEASELLLCDENGNIIEGMITNFCIVTDLQDGQGSCLWTSSPHDPALPGIMLARVLEACHCLGFQVVRCSPQASSRHIWKEAFITNCLRGIQPVSRIFCPEDNLCSQPPWDLDLPYSYGNITKKLQKKVLELQDITRHFEILRDNE